MSDQVLKECVAEVRKLGTAVDGLLDAKREAVAQRDTYKGALISIGEIIGGEWTFGDDLVQRIAEVLDGVGIKYPLPAHETAAVGVEADHA